MVNLIKRVIRIFLEIEVISIIKGIKDSKRNFIQVLRSRQDCSHQWMLAVLVMFNLRNLIIFAVIMYHLI